MVCSCCANVNCQCDPCYFLYGAGDGGSVNNVTQEICFNNTFTVSYDQPCAVTGNAVKFDGIVDRYGPQAFYPLLQSSAIAKYTGTDCMFIELHSAQHRTAVSRALDQDGVCVCYWRRPVFWYWTYIFIYRCDTQLWENITDELLTTNLYSVLDDSGSAPAYFEPRDCGFPFDNGNPPALPAMPEELPCAGPFAGCGNPFP